MISREASVEEDGRWIRTILADRQSGAAEDAFRGLLQKYWKVVAVLASNRVGDRREAEDITQEAFFRAFRSLSTLEEPSAFLGWLLKIARNLATDRIRSRRRTVSIESLGAAIPGAGERGRFEATDFEMALESEEESAQLMNAVSALPEKYREVITLKYLQGLDGKAMSRTLGEPEGTVRNRLFRALARLRACIEARKAHNP